MIRSVTLRAESAAAREEVVIVPLAKGTRKLTGASARLDKICRGALAGALADRRFEGATGDTFLITVRGAKAPAHVLLAGLGPGGRVDAENIADAAGAASKVLARHRFKSAAVLLGEHSPAGRFAHAFVKGFGLALYRYKIAQKPGPPPSVRRLAVLVSGGSRREITAAVKRARLVVEHAAIVRDLVNAPANTLTPAVLASRARSLCREHGLGCRVISASQMEREGMGAIVAVGRGSAESPRLIVMHHNKGSALPRVCLVGKGVTFDSGGISLKPWERMNEMKGDMAGGGVVTSVMAAAARLDLPLEIVGIVPCVENMPDGRALKPGDVVTTYSGKTIEILSTDAEGRLILADAITFALDRYDPDVVVDFATLTGAVLVALGTRIAGVMGNSQEHIDGLIAAGREAGEPAWQLPLDDHFDKAVDGDITDLKNYSGRDGSTITAAALLGRFAGTKPWVHVDIAGTFWSDGSGASYNPRGATGYGVDLTLRFLEDIARKT